MVALCALGLAIAAVDVLATPTPSSLEAVRRWHFSVLLNGKPIGEHDFAVTRQASGFAVETRARFRVKALFVSLYGYDHQDHEIWRDGCLAQVDAQTSDNGRESTVHGRLAGENFQVQGPAGSTSLPACVHTFAYWDPNVLTQQRLLNVQTGVYEPIEVTHLGIENVSARRQDVEAEHYALTGNKFRIDLWYSRAGEWLALESRTQKGSTLRYEIH